MSDQFNGSTEERGEQPSDAKMTEDDVRYITDREIYDSYSWTFGKIATERAKAEQYYLGLPVGDLSAPTIPGRSSIVSTDVSDTVEWLLPALIEIFTAGDDVVEFTERKAQDEGAAEQTTDLVNYVFYQQNPGWYVLYTWFKDALIQKNGIVKAWWDPTPETVREEYHGLTDIQMAMLLQDNSVKPVEHSAYPDPVAAQAMQQQFQQAQQQYQMELQQHASQPPQPGQPQQPPPQPPQPPSPQSMPMLHDVALVRTTQSGQVRLDNVPPEEFLISRMSKRIGDGACGHRVKRTVTYLRQQGYANVDDITSDTIADPSLNQEAIVRRSLEDAPYGFEDSDGNGDETMREVWLTEWYTQIDFDGDGIAEWRKIVRAGNAILENVPCDGPPFVSLCAVPLPHLFFGMSPAEQAMPVQRLKTTLWRALIDNMQMQINGRVWAVKNQVNLDDLLTNRPGGVVRVESPNSVGALQQGMSDTAGAYQLLDYADAAKQDRTGVTKYTQGSDADTLNKTAAGLENITQRSDQRIKLIARIFAETGVKDLFRLIQKLLAQYQDRSMTMKLRGEWVDVDPRAWKNQYDMTVNVGLGTGDKTKAVQHLMLLGQAQQHLMTVGAATPENLYNAAKKLPPLLGFKNADEFFTDPAKQPPHQPQPNPALIEIQAKQQSKMAEIQAQAQSTAQQNALEDARERDKIQMQLTWEREKFYAQLAVEREQIYITAGVNAQAEANDFMTTLHSTEAGVREAQIAASATASAQPSAGDGAGPASNGVTGAPADAGSAPVPAQGIQPGMGQQPGQGQ